MGLAYADLAGETRAMMIEEINSSIADGSVYISPWLSDRGKADWPELLLAAAQLGTDDSLAGELRQHGRLRETAERKNPKGGTSTYRVPITAHETIAEGEFNRFYVRGLCRRAIAAGLPHLEVYRAKQVREPRQSSEEKIGTRVPPSVILEDLRNSPGVEPALGLPPGPNSGLTLKIP